MVNARGGIGLDVLIGAAVALLLAWASGLLGARVRQRFGFGQVKFQAAAAAAVAGLCFYFLFRLITPVPRAIVDGIGIGIAVGLFQGMQGQQPPSQK
jgi:hypothetical protein